MSPEPCVHVAMAPVTETCGAGEVLLAALDDTYTRFLTPPAYDAVFATATGAVVRIGPQRQARLEKSGLDLICTLNLCG